MIKVTRYCPACHRTTKHLFNEQTGSAKCLSKVHDRNVKLGKQKG